MHMIKQWPKNSSQQLIYIFCDPLLQIFIVYTTCARFSQPRRQCIQSNLRPLIVPDFCCGLLLNYSVTTGRAVRAVKQSIYICCLWADSRIRSPALWSWCLVLYLMSHLCLLWTTSFRVSYHLNTIVKKYLENHNNWSSWGKSYSRSTLSRIAFILVGISVTLK